MKKLIYFFSFIRTFKKITQTAHSIVGQLIGNKDLLVSILLVGPGAWDSFNQTNIPIKAVYPFCMQW